MMKNASSRATCRGFQAPNLMLRSTTSRRQSLVLSNLGAPGSSWSESVFSRQSPTEEQLESDSWLLSSAASCVKATLKPLQRETYTI